MDIDGGFSTLLSEAGIANSQTGNSLFEETIVTGNGSFCKSLNLNSPEFEHMSRGRADEPVR